MLLEKIKELCKERGISIAELEKQAGLANGTIRKWDVSSPYVDSLSSVAKVLKVKPSKLID